MHGKRPQHERVDDAEDRGVGADAERERENGDGGERQVSVPASEPHRRSRQRWSITAVAL